VELWLQEFCDETWSDIEESAFIFVSTESGRSHHEVYSTIHRFRLLVLTNAERYEVTGGQYETPNKGQFFRNVETLSHLEIARRSLLAYLL
jgi:hypothetical protein